MKEKLMKKLRSRAGESLAEILVALLISALGLVLLAGMISSSANLIGQSEEHVLDYLNKENLLVAQTGTPVGSGTAELQIGGSGTPLTDGAAAQIPVRFFADDAFAGHKVISYRPAASGEG